MAARPQSQFESFGLHDCLYTKFNLHTVLKKNYCNLEVITTKIISEYISCDNNRRGVFLGWNFIWPDPEKVIVTWTRIQNFVISLEYILSYSNCCNFWHCQEFLSLISGWSFRVGTGSNRCHLKFLLLWVLGEPGTWGTSSRSFQCKMDSVCFSGFKYCPYNFHSSSCYVALVTSGCAENNWRSGWCKWCLTKFLCSVIPPSMNDIKFYVSVWYCAWFPLNLDTTNFLYTSCVQIWPELSNSISVMNFIDLLTLEQCIDLPYFIIYFNTLTYYFRGHTVA